MTPKHKYMVMKRTADDMVVDVGRGKRRTWKQNGGKSDMFYVSTESEARDIDAKYGSKGTQQVWVKEHGNMSWNASYKEDGVHNYFIAPSKSYADAWEEFEKRRKDKATGRKVRGGRRAKRPVNNRVGENEKENQVDET